MLHKNIKIIDNHRIWSDMWYMRPNQKNINSYYLGSCCSNDKLVSDLAKTLILLQHMLVKAHGICFFFRYETSFFALVSIAGDKIGLLASFFPVWIKRQRTMLILNDVFLKIILKIVSMCDNNYLIASRIG